MEEFLQLFLTGKRAEYYGRYLKIKLAVGTAGALLTFVSVFLNLFGVENRALGVVFLAFGFALAVAAAILGYFLKPFSCGLADLQNAANFAEHREEAAEEETLYRAWTETFAKRSRPYFLLVQVAGYAVIVAFCLCVFYGLMNEAMLLAACFISSVFFGTASVIQAVSEGRARAELYRRAGREMDDLKRRRTKKSERTIAREAENASAFSGLPRTVELFLKDDVDRADFGKITTKSTIFSLAFGILMGIAVIGSAPLSALLDKKFGSTVVWIAAGVLFLMIATLFFVLILPLERRKKAVYAANFSKLSPDDETDAMRAQLQAAWIGLQRTGNFIFGGTVGLAVVLGAIFGFVGYALDPTLVLAEQLGSCIFVFFFFGAVLSFVVWTVFYALRRRKMRPLENQLAAKLRENAE